MPNYLNYTQAVNRLFVLLPTQIEHGSKEHIELLGLNAFIKDYESKSPYWAQS